jgi:hypothetical protein
MERFGRYRFDGPPARARARAITPLALAGAALILLMRSPLGQFLHGFFSRRPLPAPDSKLLMDSGLPPALLRDSILGHGKTTVAAFCGVPPTAAPPRAHRFGRIAPSFWQADTWYYPIDSRSQTAMAVRFERHIARDVEFFESPQT